MSTRRPQRAQDDATDRRLSDALRRVDVPPGLAERIFARLGSAESHAKTSLVAAPIAASTNARRRWLARTSTALAACAAGLLIAWMIWPSSEDELDSERVMHLARSLNEPWDATTGMSIAEKTPPTKYDAGPHVMLNAETRWRPIDRGFAGRKGVAYDITARDRQHARLFVVDLRPPRGAPELRGLPHAPMQGVLSTGGVTTSAWTDGTRVYVLVVEGNENALRAFLRQPGAMA